MVTHADLKNNRELLDQVLAEVCRLENEGWQFEAAGASFDLLVERCAGSFRPVFEKTSYSVAVESRGEGEVRTEAMVKINTGGTLRHEVAEGDGPVNALDAALRKALEPLHPALVENAFARLQSASHQRRRENSSKGASVDREYRWRHGVGDYWRQ